ncbi:MATH domain and coiled-coil domain-containing protein At3g58210-like [Raphanus sativus]|uniref:MATH domain and coiled-coil domain-containing protein At3g58210-like n=1 Tax=Raphanus sativus TaxID=3726 RepID=A0A6J0NID8_RAPSA|nr:MATH domain and coiled-coil domain-containing protein At3g58210-like [Raphanus sativus]
MWNGDGTVEIDGFRVYYSEVECVRRIFERHPETAVNVRPKNQLVKNAYMNNLLDLIDIACLAPQELTEEELRDAENTLLDLVGVDFELDWLKKKLDELCVKKTKMETRGDCMRELDRMIVEQRQVLLALEVELKNEENEAVSDSARLGFEDVV